MPMPSTASAEKTRYVVCKASEIARDSSRLVEVDGRAIAVFNADGAFYAILNRCPHQGGDLCKGKLTRRIEASMPGEDYAWSAKKEIVRCPWHAWEFDLKTGRSWCDPGRVRVKSYPVGVEGGARLVEGPYRAETFEVSVEDDYVVLYL